MLDFGEFNNGDKEVVVRAGGGDGAVGDDEVEGERAAEGKADYARRLSVKRNN